MTSNSIRRATRAAGLFVVLALATRARAHDVPGIPEFTNLFPTFRTVGGTGVPNGNGGLDGRGFPIDPRDLVDATGRARVFHGHFQSAAPSTYDGTILFCVFNGPPAPGCAPSQRVLPPLPATYVNASGDYSITVDFGRILTSPLGADDVGTLSNRDWVYAYVIVNDEGTDAAVRGTDPINAFFLSFSSALRQVVFDLPHGVVRGFTIGAGGDVEPTPSDPDTTGPDAIQFSTTFGEQVLFLRSAFGEGCIPDVTTRMAPPANCNSGPHACTSNIVFLSSPFGPGVCALTHLVDGDPIPPVQTAVLGPLTYPSVDVVDVAIDNHSHPGRTIAPGDRVDVTVHVANPAPATAPPYLDTIVPGGTLRVSATVSISATGGATEGLNASQTVCMEIDQRTAKAIFGGVFVGPAPATITATAVPYAPYSTEPFDSSLLDYHGRFSVDREQLGSDPAGDATAIVPAFIDGRQGDVNGGAGVVADVLFVNGQPGMGDERKIYLSQHDPIELRIDAPPTIASGPAAFVIYVWRGEPQSATAKRLPASTGTICMPTPLTPTCAPQPVLVANTIGLTAQLGSTVWPRAITQSAPTVLASSASGTHVIGTFYLQGIVIDPGALNGQASVTNGIVLVLRY
ncbi:MAG: hypothetical protein HYR85_20695 [Planctomycetes bacterium]|nr:hypothetical protein [Planctomycetota bacterium]